MATLSQMLKRHKFNKQNLAKTLASFSSFFSSCRMALFLDQLFLVTLKNFHSFCPVPPIESFWYIYVSLEREREQIYP